MLVIIASQTVVSAQPPRVEVSEGAFERSALHYVEQHRDSGVPRVVERDPDRYQIESDSGAHASEFFVVEDEDGRVSVVVLALNPDGTLVNVQLFEGDSDTPESRRLSVYAAEYNEVDGYHSTLLEVSVRNEPPELTSILDPDTPPADVDDVGPNSPDGYSSLSNQTAALQSLTICILTAYNVYLSVGFAVGAGEISYCTVPASLRLRIWLMRSQSFGGTYLVKNYIDQWHTGVYMYRNALWSCTSTGTLKWWKNQTIGDAYWPNGHDASVLVTPPRLKLCS